MRSALVISGGGSKGAFAVGAVKLMYERFSHEGWFDIVGGTSTGALIAPFAALAGTQAFGSAAMNRLEWMYSNVETNDILESQQLWEFIHRQDCLNESDPLRALIERELTKTMFDELKRSSSPDCYVVYANYFNGAKVVASAKEMERGDFLYAMMASASVPVFMESTIIKARDYDANEDDYDHCFDGGVRDLVPFDAAIDMGAEQIVPVFLDPEEYDIAPQFRSRAKGNNKKTKYPDMVKVLSRTLSILLNESLAIDVRTVRLINEFVSFGNRLEELFPAGSPESEKVRRLIEDDRFNRLFKYKLIDLIEGIRPQKSLTQDSSLKFDPHVMRGWMEYGHRVAEEVFKDASLFA